MLLCQKNHTKSNSFLTDLDVNATMLCTNKKNVDNYNNMIDILFQNTTIYNMIIDSNAFEMIELYNWIHNPKFNQIKKSCN
jgi:cytidylate kinase